MHRRQIDFEAGKLVLSRRGIVRGEDANHVGLPRRAALHVHQDALGQQRRQHIARVESFRRARWKGRRSLDDFDRPHVIEQQIHRGRAIVRQRHRHTTLVDEHLARKVLASARQGRVTIRPLYLAPLAMKDAVPAIGERKDAGDLRRGTWRRQQPRAVAAEHPDRRRPRVLDGDGPS